MNPFDPKYFRGKNDLGSFEIFLERTFFKGFALSENGKPKQSIDEAKNLFFSEIGLHGKINPTGNVIISNPQRLARLDQKEDVLVFDFVAQAFEDMKRAIATAVRSGNISSSDEHFEKFVAKTGWVDANIGYGIYINSLKSFFMKYLQRLPTDKKRNLDDIHVFSDIFLEFYEFFSTSFPLTRTGFMMTNMISNQCSGMMVTIADYDYSSDEEKIKNFYNSVNLPAYKQAAISHGFLIDKNAPWRLIADIDNPVMQNYINQEMLSSGFDRKLFFATYFLSPDPDPISDIKNIISNLYQSAISVNKIDRKIELNARNCFEITLRRRPQKLAGQIFTSLAEVEWAELYLKIKNYETKIGYTEEELKVMARNVADLRKKLDSRPYMLYIRNRFPQIPFSEGSTNYREAKKYILESGTTLESSLSEELKRTTRIKKKTIF